MNELVLAGEMNAPAFQALQARLDLFDETIIYTKFVAGAPVLCHEVGPLDLAVAFSGVPLTTGLLPRGCLFYSHQGADLRLGLYVEPAVRPLSVEAGGEIITCQVPLPALIFLGQGTCYYAYAVKQYPGAEEVLYHAPFPNVNLLSGQICHGNVTFPACSARTIGAALDLFLNSHFNDHWTDGKSKKHKKDVLLVWKALSRRRATAYPLDDLVVTSARFSHLWRVEA